MKFIVDRISTQEDNVCPCDGAVEAMVPLVACVLTSTTNLPPKDWLETGTNHRIVNEWAYKDVGENKGWVVEIPSLANFTKREGDVIIRNDGGNLLRLTIYDASIEQD